jgi:hypothetical protein
LRKRRVSRGKWNLSCSNLSFASRAPNWRDSFHDETTRQRELREAHRRFLEIGASIRAAEVAKQLGLATAS